MTIRTLVALTIPSTAAFIVIGQPIVALIFQRGFFDDVSTQYVTWALGFYAIGLVGHSALEVLGRAFFALQDTWAPAIAAVVALVINVVLGVTMPTVFSGFGWLPHGALALATAVAALIEAGLLLWWIQRHLGTQETKAFWRTVFRVCRWLHWVWRVFFIYVPGLCFNFKVAYCFDQGTTHEVRTTQDEQSHCLVPQ